MRRWVAFALGLSALVVQPAFAICDPGETNIRIAIGPSPQTAVRDRAARGLASAIDRELQGRACAILRSDANAYSGAAALDALGQEANMALPAVSIVAQRVPAYRFLDLPFAFRDLQAVDGLAASPTGSALVAAAAGQGLQQLALFHQGMDQIAALKDVVVPADLLGAKIAVDGSAFGTRWMAEAGAPPQSFDRASLPTWLKDRRVDAVTGQWRDIDALRRDVPFAAVLETNHRYIGYVAVADAAWWRGLPAALAADLVALVSKEATEANAYAQAQSDRAKDTVLRSGIPVRTLTRAQRNLWLERVSGTWQLAERETGLDGLWDRVTGLNAYP